MGVSDRSDDQLFKEGGRLYRKRDYAGALDAYLELANRGRTEVQGILGSMYKGGLGTEKDEEKAEEWLRPAADRGEDQPTLHLGSLYQKQGRFKEMVEYYNKSAQRGYAPAICRLGVCYVNGFGLKIDKTRGLELLADAARRGNVRARAIYGVQLIRGAKGVGQIIPGLSMWLKAVLRAYLIARKDMTDDRLRG